MSNATTNNRKSRASVWAQTNTKWTHRQRKKERKNERNPSATCTFWIFKLSKWRNSEWKSDRIGKREIDWPLWTHKYNGKHRRLPPPRRATATDSNYTQWKNIINSFVFAFSILFAKERRICVLWRILLLLLVWCWSWWGCVAETWERQQQQQQSYFYLFALEWVTMVVTTTKAAAATGASAGAIERECVCGRAGEQTV